MNATLPNPAQIKALYTLQNQYSAAYKEMNAIRNMINTIMNKEAEISIRITTHDLQQHEINAAMGNKPNIPDAVYSSGFLGAIVSGSPVFPWPKPGQESAGNLKPCKDSIVFDCDDTTAVRMLNILFQEKQDNVTRLYYRIQELFAEMGELFANPVLHLNQ